MNHPSPTPTTNNTSHAYESAVRSRVAECRICLGTHDDEIHAATLSVREWFREEVTKGFHPLQLV
jgi:hypothetical protein